MGFLAPVGVALGATAGTTAATTLGMAAVGTAAGLIGTGISIYGQMRAADQREDLARTQAAAAAAETAEAQRRQSAENRRVAGLARAQAGGSGLRTTGSIGQYLTSLEEEQQRQLAWMGTSGLSRQMALIQEGAAEGSALRLAALGQGFGGFGSSLSQFGSYWNEYT